MTISIDPIIGKLGPLTFRWYGVIMAVAVIVGLWILAGQLKRRHISPDHAWGIAVFAVPLGVIGARLFHVFDNFSFYWHHPGQIFGGQLIGLAIYGVIAGGIFGLVIYCRWKKLPVLRVLDSHGSGLPGGPDHRPLREHHKRRHLGTAHQAALGLHLHQPERSPARQPAGSPHAPNSGLRAAMAARDAGHTPVSRSLASRPTVWPSSPTSGSTPSAASSSRSTG